jgi:hypothetical protein
MSISAATSQAQKGTAGPIRAMSVVSTGTVEIHPNTPMAPPSRCIGGF